MAGKRFLKFFQAVLAQFDSLNESYPLLHKNKVPTRIRVFAMIFSTPIGCAPQSGDILIEYNPLKLKHAQKVFGVDLMQVSPWGIPYPVFHRILLFPSFVMSKRLREIYLCLVARDLILHVCKQDTRLYFYNPYSCIHFVFSGCAMSHSVFLQTNVFPLFMAKDYYCNRAIYQWYSLGKLNWVNSIPEFRMRESDGNKIVFYFTKIDSLKIDKSVLPDQIDFSEEIFLRELAEHIIQAGLVAVEIYLHYSDRESKKRFGNRYLDSCLNYNPGLDNIVKNQVSVSGSSSIGLEISSIIQDHFMLLDEKKMLKGSELISDQYLDINQGVEAISDFLIGKALEDINRG